TLVTQCHLALQDDRALHRLDDAGELGQQTVAHQLEDAAMVAGDLWLEQILAMGSQAGECPSLVLLHKAGVADYIGRPDGGKLASHAAPSPPKTNARSFENLGHLPCTNDR